MEHEDGARARREARDGGVEIEPEAGTHRLGFGLEVDQVAIGSDPASPPPGAPSVRKDHVDGQAMEPGRETAVAPKGRQPFPSPDEDVLGQLVGVAGVVSQANRQRIDPADVGSVNLLEGGLITPRRRRNRGVERSGGRPGFSAGRASEGNRNGPGSHESLDAGHGSRVY